ncbi:hypothetical protein [Streptomyces sp. NPDC060077]|uniref:hypothetical protein n=1 Tax=Streptomyces sp. NPDC060077 TaxID=3347052 RepID=UPI00364C32B4
MAPLGFTDVNSEPLAFTDWAPDGPLTEMLGAAREQLRARLHRSAMRGDASSNEQLTANPIAAVPR